MLDKVPSTLCEPRVIMVRLTPEAMEGNKIGVKVHPIDIINTNSTLESTLRLDILVPNTNPLND